MKKVKVVLSALAAMMLIASLCYAEAEGGMRQGGDMSQKGMEKHGKMSDMCPRHCMMMMKKMSKSMVATSDGGVVVMSGNRLLKYNKDLELKKEVKIKADSECMEGKAAEMKEGCPMCGKMKAEGKTETPE